MDMFKGWSYLKKRAQMKFSWLVYDVVWHFVQFLFRIVNIPFLIEMFIITQVIYGANTQRAGMCTCTTHGWLSHVMLSLDMVRVVNESRDRTLWNLQFRRPDMALHDMGTFIYIRNGVAVLTIRKSKLATG